MLGERIGEYLIQRLIGSGVWVSLTWLDIY